MKRSRHLPALAALLGLANTAQAALIAHYTFDAAYTESSETRTADSVGSGNYARLGGRVLINTTTSKVGAGALEMLGGGSIAGPGDGAVTNNNFSWTNDARTVTFWWKAKTPNVNSGDGAFVSFGSEAANGTRFDIKEQGASSNNVLRVEVQGTGQTTTPTNFDDGNWHFVAVTVPNAATFKDIKWYVNGGSNLNTSTNTLDIATGTGPIAFGDSIVTTSTAQRTPNGFLDDVQIYDEVLTTEQISFLYNNPGSVIPEPGPAAFVGAFGLLALLRRRR